MWEKIAEIFSQAEVWIGYLLTLISLISFVIAIIKAVKEKKFGKIKDLMIGFIQEAESLKAKDGESPISGQSKKEIVLAKISTACGNLGYKFNENVWSTLIDEYVEFTLKVNSTDENKAKVEQKVDVETDVAPEQTSGKVSF